jgi:hypothetical protein
MLQAPRRFEAAVTTLVALVAGLEEIRQLRVSRRSLLQSRNSSTLTTAFASSRHCRFRTKEATRPTSAAFTRAEYERGSMFLVDAPQFADYGQRMSDAMVDQVRRFNRVVTERVGALNDPFLGRERPLGEARLLWEIGLVAANCGWPEIKRIWIPPRARGLGLRRRLLERLEVCALAGGARVAHIGTTAILVEALSLYRSTGWVEVPAFNDEPFADHWLEKRLT